jgi:uncharacterized repeat protein (TIGR04076 family)
MIQGECSMKRSRFIKIAAAGSVYSMTGVSLAGNNVGEKKTKVTVLKRTLNEEWNNEFRNGQMAQCDRFQDGQEFVIESPWNKPEGFCEWAWADIRTYIHLVDAGKYETFVSCCTDGFRPVFFKIDKNEK